MNTLNICPCCSNPLIHQLGDHRDYWFCRHCWSEMPNLEALKVESNRETAKAIDLSPKLSELRQPALAN